MSNASRKIRRARLAPSRPSVRELIAKRRAPTSMPAQNYRPIGVRVTPLGLAISGIDLAERDADRSVVVLSRDATVAELVGLSPGTVVDLGGFRLSGDINALFDAGLSLRADPA